MRNPNVLLICVDHFPGLLLGAAGHSHIQTPTLDRLCENGIRFDQAYSATPTCIPARRALMTGTTSKTHGDRIFKEKEPMDHSLPTMAQTFRDAGYQAYAVGKLHVYPQRDRIGFDDVILNEEGRHHLGGGKDDYELFLEREGYAGQEYTHGMGNNDYYVRPWHLPEAYHPTYWTTKEMCKTIQRKDPTKPSFWYCSYTAPHPPITPPNEYLDMYRDIGVDEPMIGDWAMDPENFPYALKKHQSRWLNLSKNDVKMMKMGFYAQCTYIDHQIRLLLGTLREEGLMDDTIIMLTCDHGDMLMHHNLLCKPPMYEYSSKIPMILVPNKESKVKQHHFIDHRLAELRDVMPTLLDLCSVNIPKTVEGISLVSGEMREHLYCEHHEGDKAMRMIRYKEYKLIWYPVGNQFHLFNLETDPFEMKNIGEDPKYASIKKELCNILLSELYGSDEKWVSNSKLIGEPDKEFIPIQERSYLGQRGWR